MTDSRENTPTIADTARTATRPRIAITLGDPGGIGPEVAARAVCDARVQAACIPVLYGDATVVRDVDRMLDLPVEFRAVDDSTADMPPGVVAVYQPPDSPRVAFRPGGIAEANGRAAACWIEAAARDALAGRVSAITTAPICKEALYLAGYTHPGHTEFLAHQCGGAPVRMMLEGGGLRVVLHTIHVALAQVPALVTADSLDETLRIAAAWQQRYGATQRGAGILPAFPPSGSTPRGATIAVCGLNPHAGESGHFGTEEIDTIAPAIARAQSAGLPVTGPFSADTLFHRARQGEFSMIIAMYHDQALIPIKTLDFDGGVNITIGLPLIRTSPDHGTAFEIAGRGIAREQSMVAAILRAAELAGGKEKYCN